ncbi:MAG: SH3 domain-containing protein [Victivallales bacterium]|jgi:uncharacterized protein YgiM (DUF1202 family)
MNKYVEILLLSALLSIPLSDVFCADAVEGTVKVNVLNVRVKPGDKHALVAEMSRNEKVRVVNFEKGWYEIAAPAKSSVWISTAFVKDGVVAKKAYLRTGPSVACTPYAMSADEGAKIEVLDSTQDGWLRISPLGGMTGWINAELVDVAPRNADAVKNEEKENLNSDKLLEKGKDDKKELSPTRDNQAGAKSSFTGASARIVSYEGFLVAVDSNAANAGVTHALASRTNGQYFPLCYVYSKKMNLKLWEGRKIQVTGQERWIKDWQRPVVELEMVNSLGAL